MMLLGLWMLMLLKRCGCQAADAPEDATADFSVRLYHLLRIAGGEENIIFSPLSVTLTLGMLELGARGSSLEEIRQAVGREDEDVSVLSNLTLGQSEDEHVLHLLNSLVLQPDVELNPQLLQIMKKLFRVEMQMLNFSHPDDTVQYINSWVLNQTQNKISEMVSVDDFSGSTRMMLVNAVYFRGSWKNQFRPENTRTFSFTKDDGSEVQTLMMYQQGDFYYGEFSDGSTEAGGVYQVLEMLYEGEDMSMMIVLPRQEVPLASLEPIIRAPLLEEWASNVKRQKVEVYLPRFKVEQKLNLKELLKELSIRSIFTEDADLSAMTTDGQGLVLGAAVQKSYLEVTEEGAEGVAGSGMMALTRTLVLYPQVMADHPFFFIIRNRKTGTILFIGRVMTPDLIQPFSDI